MERLDPVQAQLRVLRDLLRTARGTRFGVEHDFETIDSVARYQTRVPVRDFERFRREWWDVSFPVLENDSWPGRIPFFAESSGTTGGPTKHIPVSAAMVDSNRHAALEVLMHHVARQPDSHPLGGPSLLLGGSTSLRKLPGGARSGDLSGVAAATLPLYVRGRVLPSREIALCGDWDEKIARIADTLPPTVRTISGTPSWLLLLFEQLAVRHGTPGSIAAALPQLELVIHGGTGFAPYRGRFADWLEPLGAKTREVYAASEGFIALADRDPDEGMRLMLDNGLFFEFLPPGELDDALAGRPVDARWIANAEPGRDYALLLSSNAGLWRYPIGDVVRLVSRTPPRLVVSGRTAHTLNAFGEHVSGGELDRAMEAAARACGVRIRDYTATALYPRADEPRGAHLFLVELDGADRLADEALFLRTLDQVLAENNIDYATHRQGDFGMAPPALRILPPGRFEGWMRARGKLGGQNKVPRVLEDASALLG